MDERVGACAAIIDVTVCGACRLCIGDDVVAITPIDSIKARSGIDLVVLRRARNRIVAGRPIDKNFISIK